jgi:hypothetical protein
MAIASTLAVLLERLAAALGSRLILGAIVVGVYLFGRLVAVRAVDAGAGIADLDETLALTLRKVTLAVFFLLGLYLAVPLSGLATTPTTIAALSAGGTIAIGFASQDILSNLVSGAFIVADPKFRIGDWIIWDDKEGIIEDIGFDIRQFSYFATLVFEHPMITVGHHVDIDSWDDFVEKVQAGELLFGTVGPASTTAFNNYIPGHVTGLWSIDDVLDNMVIYDGTAEMIPAILREDIDVLSVAVSSALTYVEEGSVKPILFLSMDDPPEAVGDVPTLATEGVEGGQQIADMVPTRRSMAGPPELPDDLLQLWRDAFEALLIED